MSESLPKPSKVRIGGLSRAAQKLQAAQEKAARAQNSGGKPQASAASNPSFKAKSFTATKKTSFQRKAV